MTQLKDEPARAVFLTGASGGIGSAAARLLAGRGYRVYAGVRNDSPALRDIPGVEQIRIEVTDPASVARAAEEVAARQSGVELHAVVNNAGILIQGPLELVPADDLVRQFAVNVFGPVEVIRAFAPLVRAGSGRVINVSAPTAKLPMPFAAPISASKAALDAISDALRIELAARDVKVVTVYPGAVDTQIFAKADATGKAALQRADPDRVAAYRSQMEAMEAATAAMKTAAPDTVANLIAKAIQAPRPKAQYAAGDARPALLLARLPVRLRDRLVMRLLGLGTPPADARHPAAARESH